MEPTFNEIPPNRPIFFETNHYFSKLEPSVILTHLKEICDLLDIDIDPESVKYSFKCTSYVVYSQINFIMSLFSDDKNIGTYIIEFQRRNGDSIFFNEVVSKIRKQLIEKHVIEKKVISNKKTWSFKFTNNKQLQEVHPLFNMPLKPAAEYSSFPIIVDDSKNSLVSHAFTQLALKYQVVRFEAAQAIAHMSIEDQFQRLIIEKIDIIIQCLNEVSTEIHRFAINTLVNLFKSPYIEYDKIINYDVKIYELMRTKGISPHVLRECCHALIALYGKNNTINAPNKEIITNLNSHYCHRVRNCANNLADIINQHN